MLHATPVHCVTLYCCFEQAMRFQGDERIAVRNRRLFAMTDTLLQRHRRARQHRAQQNPTKGGSTPAAMGIPMPL